MRNSTNRKKSASNNANYQAFKMFYLNIQSLRYKINELESFLLSNDTDYDVLCVSEHWLNEAEVKLLNICGMRVSSNFCRSVYQHGGVAILAKPCLQFLPLLEINKISVELHFEVSAALCVKLNLVIINVYRSPNGNFDVFLRLLELVLSKVDLCNSIIVCGDFNVRFGSHSVQCSSLCDLLQSYGFAQTIFSCTRNNNCLDNIFVNRVVTEFESKTMNAYISDHLGIVFEAKLAGCVGSNTISNTVCRPITEIGCFRFHQLFSNVNFDQLLCSDMNAESKYNSFFEKVMEIFEISFPEKILKNKERDAHISWFSPELKRMRQSLATLYDLYSVHKTAELRVQRNALRCSYRLALKQAKIDANDKIITRAGNSSKAVWKLINANRDSVKVKNPVSFTANDLNKFFVDAPGIIMEKLPSSHIQPLSICFIKVPLNVKFSLSDVSFNEIRDVISSLKTGRTKDFYGLNSYFLKINIDSFVIPLTKLINDCFKTGVIPNCMKIATVLPLHKSGGTEVMSNYRPISILPVFSKVFEKVLNNQIRKYFEVNSLFNKQQFGFRANCNTSDAISLFISNTIKCFEVGGFSLSVFCDLSKAFDCVDHNVLLEKLKIYNFDDRSRQVIKSYLSDRFQVVKLDNDISDPLQVKVGVPQGSILGPLLFLIFFNDMPYYMEEVCSIFFADDTTLTVSDRELDVVAAKSVDALQCAKTWFSANKLCLNEAKTHKLIFSLRETDENFVNIETVKFLGVVLDCRLTWSSHVDQVAGKMSSSIYALRSLSNCVSKTVLRSAYFGICHSLMEYAIINWGHATSCYRIFALQRRAVRIVGGVGYRSDCKELFRSLKILTFPCLFILQCLIFIKQNLANLNLQEDFHEHDTRYKKDIRSEYLRLKKSQNGQNFLAIKFFNCLPSNIRELSLHLFKNKVKCFLVNMCCYTFEEYLNVAKNII